MLRYSTLVVLLVSFFLFSSHVHAAPAPVTPLHLGDLFPEVVGETLTSKSLELPAAAAGKPAVIVFSFSKTAGKDARLWNEHLSKDFSNAGLGYDVIVLESVPKLFRGMAVSGIRSSMPPPLQDRTIVLYKDEELWKGRLAVSDDQRAYVVLLGPDDHLVWSNSSAFSDSQYEELKNALTKLLQLTIQK